MKRGKRPGVYQRGGRWLFVVDAPRGPDGKRRQEWHGGFATETAAHRARQARLGELRGPSYVPPSGLTVGEFLDRWLDHARARKGERTAGIYADQVRLHLAPALGALPLERLAPVHVERYYDTAPRSDGRGRLAPRTLRNHHSILRQALAAAVRWDLLPRSPMDRVASPRFVAPTWPVLDAAECRRLLEAAASTYLYPALLLALGAGMRIGECLALRWGDLAAGSCAVSRSAARIGGRWLEGPTKGRRERAVLLPPSVAAALEALRGEPAGLVVVDDFGERAQPSRLRRDYRRLLEAAGLPVVRFHDLRHSHASLLFDAGVPLPAIAARLGHASVAVTAAIYAHRLPGADQAAAEGIERALRAAG